MQFIAHHTAAHLGAHHASGIRPAQSRQQKSMQAKNVLVFLFAQRLGADAHLTMVTTA
jgi:hypothetical protein